MEQKNMPLISVQDVSVLNGKKHLLYQVNWQILKGEHWLIFGMNGSGKTTLLSLIAGYQTPSKGSIEVKGQHYQQSNLFQIRKQIGWISSSFFDKFFRNESVLYVILSGLSGTLGISAAITDTDILFAKKLLRLFQIEHKIDLPYVVLSKGERQAVLIARALIGRPEILILDEPSSGLDIYAQKVLQMLLEYLEQHTEITILYVTHHLDEIKPFLRHTMLMRNGRVYAKGATEDILTTEVLSNMLGQTVTVMPQPNQRRIIDIEPMSPEQLSILWNGV